MIEAKATLQKKTDGMLQQLSADASGLFPRGSRILVKLHMGEPGNMHYIKPELARKIAEALTGIGCRVFLFDTPVVYNSPRNNPAGYLEAVSAHGYAEEFIGAPVIVSDDHTMVSGRHMDYGIASRTVEADGVLLLSHFKGHMCSGMGGAIKNVGMGCMSKETKGRIHTGGEPVYSEGCTGCGLCVENCPTDNIRLSEGRPWFDANWCPGCSNCIKTCPEGCIKPKNQTFDMLLAEAAVLAHQRFRSVYAVNVMMGMTRLCDCIADSGPIVADDIGYLCAPDMLTADIASLEILAKRTGREDIFREHNKVSSWGHVREAAALMERDLNVDIEGS